MSALSHHLGYTRTVRSSGYGSLLILMIVGFTSVASLAVGLCVVGGAAMAGGLAPPVLQRSVAGNSLADLDTSSTCSNDPPASTSRATVTGGSGSAEAELLKVCNIPPYRGAGGVTHVHGDVRQPSGWVHVTSSTSLRPTCETDLFAGLYGTNPSSAEFTAQADSGVELQESLTHSPKSSGIYLTLLHIFVRCRSFSYRPYPQLPNGGYTLTGTYRRAVLPRYGDESGAFIQTVDVSRLLDGRIPNFPTCLVLIRQGQYVMLLAFDPDSSSFQAKQMEPYVAAALASLAGHPIREEYPLVRTP